MRHVFISYSHNDNDFAQLLKTELQTVGIQTWLALENLKAGEDWRESIDDAIKDSFAIIVIISPSSDESKYVTYEWALGYGFGIPIIPILYKPISLPKKSHPRLDTLQYEDFTSVTNRPWIRVVERLNEIHTEALKKENRDPKIEEAIHALHNWDSTTIARAADMLGRRKVQSAIPELLRLLDEPDPIVQNAAIKSLGEIGALQAVERIIEFVNKDETHLDSIQALGKIGDSRAEEVLIQAFKSDNEKTKFFALKALKNILSPNIKDVLLQFLKEQSFEEYFDAEELLAGIFDVLSNKVSKEDINDLLNLLTINNDSIRIRVIVLLGELQDELSLVNILKLARNKSKIVRDAALSALQKFTKLSNFAAKLELAKSDNLDHKEEVIDYFYNYFGLEGLIYLIAYDGGNVYWEATKQIENIITASEYHRIIEALDDASVRVRALMAEIIRHKHILNTCDKLRTLLSDSSPFVRGLAVRTIGDIKCKGTINHLKSLLEDKKRIFANSEDTVSDFATIALGKLKNRIVIPNLQELSLNSKSSLQAEAVELLIPFQEAIDKSLFKTALYDVEANRRISAFKILGVLENNIDVIASIKELQENDAVKEREKIIDNLASIYNPVGLIVLLAVDNIKSHWEIAEALQERFELKHISIINQFLNDNHYRVAAFLAEVIGLRPDLGIGKQIIPLVDHKEAFVRGLAIRALGRLKCEAATDRIRIHLNDFDTIYSNSDIQVCEYSVNALIRLGEQISSTQLFDVIKKNPQRIQGFISKIHKLSPSLITDELISMLLNLLLSDQTLGYAANYIVSIVGEFGSPKDAHTLLDFLATSNEVSWYTIEEAVKKLADESINSKVLTLLDIDKKDLRIVCLNILAIYGDETFIIRLLDLLDDENDPTVMFRIIDTVATFGTSEILTRVVPFSTFGDALVRGAVVRAYGKLKDINSTLRILPFLEDQAYSVRSEAVQALINVGDRKIVNLLIEKMKIWENEELSTEDDIYIGTSSDFREEACTRCLKAVGELGNNSHTPMLKTVAQHHEKPSWRGAALIALSNLGQKTSIDTLIDRLADREYSYIHAESVCDIAAKILNSINSTKARKALDSWLASIPDEEKPDFATSLDESF